MLTAWYIKDTDNWSCSICHIPTYVEVWANRQTHEQVHVCKDCKRWFIAGYILSKGDN